MPGALPPRLLHSFMTLERNVNKYSKCSLSRTCDSRPSACQMKSNLLNVDHKVSIAIYINGLKYKKL
jgi:hypothetical protein